MHVLARYVGRQHDNDNPQDETIIDRCGQQQSTDPQIQSQRGYQIDEKTITMNGSLCPQNAVLRTYHRAPSMNRKMTTLHEY